MIQCLINLTEQLFGPSHDGVLRGGVQVRAMRPDCFASAERVLRGMAPSALVVAGGGAAAFARRLAAGAAAGAAAAGGAAAAAAAAAGSAAAAAAAAERSLTPTSKAGPAQLAP